MDSLLSSYDSTGDSRDVPRMIFHRRAVLTADSAPIPAKTIDISSVGTSVIINRPLPEGQKCTIRISTILAGMPAQVEFKCSVQNSVLVGTKGFRIGLQFVQPDIEASDLVKQIMQEK